WRAPDGEPRRPDHRRGHPCDRGRAGPHGGRPADVVGNVHQPGIPARDPRPRGDERWRVARSSRRRCDRHPGRLRVEGWPRGGGRFGEVPDRAIDRSVGVVRFDDLAGRAIAVTFSYGCHPVLHGPRPRAISSDYPGAARALVERNLAPGAGGPPVALFLQGCGGDINPRYGIGADEDPSETKDREGTVLGAEVLRVASEIRTNARRGPRGRLSGLEFSGWPGVPGEEHAAPRIASVARTSTLPLGTLPTLDVAEGI